MQFGQPKRREFIMLIGGRDLASRGSRDRAEERGGSRVHAR